MSKIKQLEETIPVLIKKMPRDVHNDLIKIQAYHTLHGEKMNFEQVIFKCIKLMKETLIK